MTVRPIRTRTSRGSISPDAANPTIRIIIVVIMIVSSTMNPAPAVYASSRWRERSKIIVDEEKAEGGGRRFAPRGTAAAGKIADNCGFHPKTQILSEDKRDGL